MSSSEKVAYLGPKASYTHQVSKGRISLTASRISNFDQLHHSLVLRELHTAVEDVSRYHINS